MNIAEIITIGDEILIGQTIDTNSAWMGTVLNDIGIRVNRITSVSDRREEITDSLAAAMSRSDLVLITGGLGPTSDDITKGTLADFFGGKMIMNDGVLRELKERLSRRNIPLNDNNLGQAYVPDNCTVLLNRAGTAPGMLFHEGEKIIVSMPGVPHEMKHLMNEYVLPMLSEMAGRGIIVHKNIMTFGIPEAILAERLIPFETSLPASVKLAYLPAFGIIKLRLTVTGDDHETIMSTISDQLLKLYNLIPDAIYAEDEVTLEEKIGLLLNDNKLTLSTAESCTGGRIASLVTSVPGSSAWFRGSVVAYSNDIKVNILGVNEETLERFGAVSRETAEEMARGIRRITGTDFSVSATGIAGPSGGSPDKPVGTVWIAVDSPLGTVANMFRFADDRYVNISRSSYTALDMLRKQIIRQ